MSGAAPAFRIEAIELLERPVRLRLPFRFGVVTLTECPQAFARARIALPDGKGAWGAAAELMAPKWFDKNLELSNEDNFTQLRTVLQLARDAYLSDAAPDTAFGHFARHHDAHEAAGARLGYSALLSNYGPAVIDRALLDALCRALEVSFHSAMKANLAGVGTRQREFGDVDVPALLAGLRPADTIEARHTVGMLDAITQAELHERVNDGLPQTLEEVISVHGHRWFKLKVGGRLREDIARLASIAAVLDRAAEPYFVSLDGNEQYESAEAVAELLAAIASQPRLRRLWQSTAFIEQPISRQHALDTDLDGVHLGKPVIIDESDGVLDAFVQARRRGYAGVSSKTCKGIYRSLLNAARCVAWNAEGGGTRYFMSAEDLTTQAGLAVQQDLALVNLLGITHVERNGHHYVNGLAAQSESEQRDFLRAHPDLYERSHGAVRLAIQDGRIRLGSLSCSGYASGAMPDFAGMQPLASGGST